MPALLRRYFLGFLVLLVGCGGNASPGSSTPSPSGSSPSPVESPAPAVEEARNDLCGHIAHSRTLTSASGDIAAAAAFNLRQLSLDMDTDADTYAAAGDDHMAGLVRRLAKDVSEVADGFEASNPDPADAFQAFTDEIDGLVADLPSGLCD